MNYLPLFLDLKQKKCLVVGAGEVAARKINMLNRAGADITVIATHISPAVTDIQQSHNLTIQQKAISVADIQGFRLVISATNHQATNELVAKTANEHNILVNVVDNPALCSFVFPAIIDRSPIVAAISSGGSSPVLARLLRAKLESTIPASYGKLAAIAEKFRTRVKQHINDEQQRRIFWERVLQGSIAELVFAGKTQQAEQELTELLNNTEQQTAGEVCLIGAGPGDPDLLTFRALRLMQQADVVVYDRLVSAEILDMSRRDSEKIYVGKQKENHSVPQQKINELLVTLAQQGKRVVRLKGGDPFIFGRGGEEIETLAEAGINFQIVPGITAASGCASYAGIPLTHRDHAQSCTFVTGHLKDGSINLNWEQLATPNQTLVFYMGLSGIDKICQTLIDYGRPQDYPIALIQKGTTQQQQVITGTLQSFPKQIAEKNIHAPTLIIVGTVVKLHEQLKWFNPNSNNNPA